MKARGIETKTPAICTKNVGNTFFLVFHYSINLPWQSRLLFLGVATDLLETTINQIEIKEELKPESNDLDFNYSDPLTTSFIKQDVEEYEQGTSFLKISNS